MNPQKHVTEEDLKGQVSGDPYRDKSFDEETSKWEYPDTEIMDEHQMEYQNELQNGR